MKKIIPESFSAEMIISQYSPECSACGCSDFQSSQHPHREILIPLHGTNRYMINNSVYDFSPGTIGLIDRFVPHAFGYTQADCDLLHLWVTLGNRAHGFVSKVHYSGKCESARSVIFPDELMRFVDRRWDRLTMQNNITDDMVAEFMKQPLELIVNEFFLINCYQDKESEEVRISDFIKNYIRRCCARDCSMNKLAEVSGYSPSHLAHSFCRETGMTIGAFIDTVRGEYTRHALDNGMTQKEIAYELGFSSPASFWNWFNKHRNLAGKRGGSIKKK